LEKIKLSDHKFRTSLNLW